MSESNLFGLIGSSISLLAGLIILIVLFHNRKEPQHLIAPMRHAMLQSQLEIQEKAYENMANEIHDNIGQMLSLAKLNLNTLDAGLPQMTHEKIIHSKELVGRAITDLRQLSNDLRPNRVKESGLVKAIQHELRLAAKTGQVETTITTDGRPQSFDPQKELILFRVFQEILGDRIRLGNAKTVFVRLLYRPGLFNLTVSDDGQGLNMGQTLAKEQPVEQNIFARLAVIGAGFDLSSIPGKHTNVSIDLPFGKINGQA